MKSKISTTKDPDLAAWCAALAAPTVTDTVPVGWHTTREIAARLGKGGSTIGGLLCRAVREGRAERQDFRITSGQVTRPVPHYRLLK
jgi:hypothetical protein